MRKIYLLGNGKLLVKEKCLVFEKYEKGKKFSTKIPYENLDVIVCGGKIGFSPNSIRTILTKELKVVLLNSQGVIKGVILPISKAFSALYVKQAFYYMEKRLDTAKAIVNGLKYSAIKCLSLMESNDLIKSAIEEIENIVVEGNIDEIMGYESRIWKTIYDLIRVKYFSDFRRSYNPPKDEMNCIISYGNSLLYSLLLVKVIEEGLNPKIGFLHQINEDRYSLVLDLSEIFKPFIILLLNLTLLKNRILNEFHFEKTENGVFLNVVGKSLYIKYFENLLKEKINVFPSKGKSLESFIEFEVKKLKNCIIKSSEYYPWVDKNVCNSRL